MRERIERQIEQRTAMLTGVSHDLRTILTRFKLQLGPGRRQAENQGKPSIRTSTTCSHARRLSLLRSRRGLGGPGRFDLEVYFQKLGEEANLRKCKLSTTLVGDPTVHVRPSAFARLLSNVIGNAFRYARTVEVNATHGRGSLLVTIDDDGPGIPADRREDVFKPSLPAARRGPQPRRQRHGLGCRSPATSPAAMAATITLDDSPLGGLRAVIKVPA